MAKTAQQAVDRRPQDAAHRAAHQGPAPIKPLAPAPWWSDDDVPAKLVQSRDTRLILERIEWAHSDRRIAVLEGPPGTSKTSVLKWYASEHRTNAVYLPAITDMRASTVIHLAAAALDVHESFTNVRTLLAVIAELRRRQPAILLIDEAQHLMENQARPFESLRDIIEYARCGCVLAGHFNFLRHLTNGYGQFLEQWLSRIDSRDHLMGLQRDELPAAARHYFGEPLDAETLKVLADAAQAKDRNWSLRAHLSGRDCGIKYLNFRRVQKVFANVEKLRSIPANQSKPLGQLLRAASKMMMEAL